MAIPNFQIPKFSRLLPDKLWTGGLSFPRSEKLTVLFADRYRFPRIDKKMTSHAFWELTCTLGGNGSIITEETIPIKENTTVLVPPNISHKELSDHNLDTIWIGFYCDKLLDDIFPSISWVEDENITELVKRLWLNAERNSEGSGIEIDALFTILLNRYYQVVNQRGVTNLKEKIDMSIKLFNEHYQDNITIADVAQKCGLSEGYFYNSFHKIVGMTPQAYLASIRIRCASNMILRTSMTLREIANACGYNDVFYFSRIFKKNFGVSPKFYRKNKEQS